MKTIIVGFGEVGRAHFNILSRAYPNKIFYKDKGSKIYDSKGRPCHIGHIELMLIATQCDPAKMGIYHDTIKDYEHRFWPEIIDILTTTPCGTVETLHDILGDWASVNKSSTRGMHPNLEKFLLDIPKHIGGPSRAELKEFYEGAGIPCVIHEKARTVELAHILNNFIYGVNVMAADEAAKYCRHYGIDYMEFLEYRKTNNSGFLKAGFPSKMSPILYPSGGVIGGHCVKYAPSTIEDSIKGPLAKMLEQHG